MGIGGWTGVFAEGEKALEGDALVGGFNYKAKVRVLTDGDGNITRVMDNGTKAPSGSDGFWSRFIAGGGLERFVGKNKDSVDSVEVVTGATVATEAVKSAVKRALSSNKPADENGKSKDSKIKLTPGEYNGEAVFPYMNDPTRKVKVKVTIGDSGKIEKVVDGGTSKPFSIKQAITKYWNLLKKENWFKGFDLEDVRNMNTTFATSPQVPGVSEQWGYAAIAQGVQKAVLNALGEKIPEKIGESDSDKVIESEAPVIAEPYKHKLRVRISQDGRVVSVADNGTIVRTPQGSIIHDGGQNVTTDDEKRIKKFEDAKGYEMFVGKSLSEVKSLEIGKHGVDTVAGATFTTEAVRQGVINAFKKGGYPDQAPIEIKGKEYTGESKTPIAAINKIAKVRVIVDENKRIIRAYDNGTFPGERKQESSRGPADNDWDKFAKFRGFARFNGRTLDELKEMSPASKDSIYVAGGTTQIFESAKEAIINALEKAEINLDREPLKRSIATAEKAKEGVLVSVDGAEVSPDIKWTENAKMEELNTAIAKGKEIYAKLDDATNQEELNTATKAMDAAVRKFTDSLKSGKKSTVKPETKLTPGVKKGIYKDGNKQYRVSITLNDDLRISSIDIIEISAGFSAKKDARDFTGKYNAQIAYLGKNLQDVINMDVANNMGAHVPGSASIAQTSKYFAKISQGVKSAVLNAMGYEGIKASPTDKTVNAEANTNRFNYSEKITLKISSDGRVVSVSDNGTKVQTNYKTTDNLKRLELFEKGNGFDKFIGKTLPQIKAMDISKHGVDSVAGATYTSNAVRDAVVNGYKAAGYDTGVPAEDLGGKEYLGESKSTFSAGGSQYKAKVRLIVGDDGRIIKTINNNSVPGERIHEGLNDTDNQWDKFAKGRGFAKFNGKNMDEVESMVVNNPDSIFVAGKQVEISIAAKEAVLDALKKAVPKKEPVNLDNLKAELSKAKESMKGVKTSPDGSTVPPTEKWVTPKLHQNLLDEILKAENIVNGDAENLNKDDVDNTTNKLKEALEAFETAKKSGTKMPKVNKTDLKNAIKKAEDLIANVIASENGLEVDPKNKWATEDAFDTFQEEIDNAKAIADSDDPSTTQKIVDETLRQLEAEKSEFEKKAKAGTKQNSEVPSKPGEIGKEGTDPGNGGNDRPDKPDKGNTDNTNKVPEKGKSEPERELKKPVLDTPEILNKDNAITLDGAGDFIYTIGESKGLNLRFINVDPEDFKSLKLDEKTLEKERDFTIEKGSIITKLKKTFLDNATKGRHIIAIDTKRGVANAHVVIKERKKPVDKTVKPEKPKKMENSEKMETPEKTENSDKMVTPEKTENSGRTDKTESADIQKDKSKDDRGMASSESHQRIIKEKAKVVNTSDANVNDLNGLILLLMVSIIAALGTLYSRRR